VIHSTHLVEPTSGQVAEILRQRLIPGIQLIQANVAAAAQHPPVRFIHEELTSAFKPLDTAPRPLTYERARPEWWHERLARIPGAGALNGSTADDFRFFDRFPDLTWTQARNGDFAGLSWEAGFDEPLPEAVTARLDVPDDAAVYALSWPNGSRVGYAPADSDYFGEVVVRIPSPVDAGTSRCLDWRAAAPLGEVPRCR
jgi:hypothetical protein